MAISSRLSGFVLGAGLMYFFDPARGRRRRAELGNAAVHARRRERELVDKAITDARHRARGLTERVKHRSASEVSDEVLDGRIRARLGRVVSHPRAIEPTVHAGTVVLRGAIFEHEAEEALATVRGIPGVATVTDELARHVSAETTPALQGEGHVRGRGHTWTPVLRVGAIGGGALLGLYGLLRRRGLSGLALAAAGGALVTRGITNRPLRLGDGGITVHKTMTVHAPIDRVRELWNRLEEFPQFLEHVHRVEVDGTHSRWTVDGPPGTTLTFDAETMRNEPNLIAWRTLPGQTIQHAGTVRFEPFDDGTRVHIEMSYRPVAGMVGHAIARMLGFDPRHRLDDDFVRLQALLEDGFTRAHHQRFELRS